MREFVAWRSSKTRMRRTKSVVNVFVHLLGYRREDGCVLRDHRLWLPSGSRDPRARRARDRRDRFDMTVILSDAFPIVEVVGDNEIPLVVVRGT